MTRRVYLPILAFMFTLALSAGVQAESRIALVIGNSEYLFAPLSNPKNDALLMSKTLAGLGFDVISVTDASQRQMKKAIKKFGKKLNKAGKDGVGLFFYAGHGVQVNGENYLIPTDAEIETEGDVDIDAINAGSVLAMMEFSGTRLSFVIMDACRNNPFKRSFRSAARGLAKMEASTGSLIAYATAPGSVAADGSGTNSPYTKALSQAMTTPGLPVERMFREVRNSVRNETNDLQTPWESSSLVGGDFYFNVDPVPAPAPVVATLAPIVEAPAPVIEADKELIFWGAISNSEDASLYQAYLEQYPDGAFAALARVKVKKLSGPTYQITALDMVMFSLQETTVRNLPLGSGDKMGSLMPSEKVSVTGQTKVRGSNWYRVTFADGQVGFVFGKQLGQKPIEQPVEQPAEQPAQQPAQQTAMLQIPAPVVSASRSPGQVFQDCSGCPEMVVVGPGSFKMGDLDGNGEDNEKPVHEVTIDYTFAVGKYEVTQAEWLDVMGDNPSKYEGHNRPVENVSWDDAKDYIQRLNDKTGKQYRLLSEAEWEYAARSGTNTRWACGNNFRCLDSLGWYISENRIRFYDVGLKQANAFGLYDMHGNVWEWVEDCWSDNYNGASVDGSSRTSDNCEDRVLRGGSATNEMKGIRSASRIGSDYSARNVLSSKKWANWSRWEISKFFVKGFRVALTLP